MKINAFIVAVLSLISISFQNIDRYKLVKPESTEFENENYLDSLQKFNSEIEEVYERFSESVHHTISQEGRKYKFKIWYRKEQCAFGITFDPRYWSRNLRCNVHNQSKVGFEAVSPNFIIRDIQLGLDYCFFIGDLSLIKEENLKIILKETFELVDVGF